MSAPMKPDREPDASSVNGGGEKPSEAACGRPPSDAVRRFNMVSPPHGSRCLHLGR
jgi:hypothetical protein